MKKSIKVILIFLGILVSIIVIDSLQAKILDNRPFIKVSENYDGGYVLKKDKGILVYTYVFIDGKKVTVYRWEKYAPPLKASETNNNSKDKSNDKSIEKNEENEKMKNDNSINVIINSEKYSVILEDNETVKEFLNLLPQEFNMKELNGNEKYVYLDYALSTNSINPKHIEAGDVMLYGDNCLVIFYKSFDTSYSYTKIGHIDDLEDLGNGSITVKFER